MFCQHCHNEFEGTVCPLCGTPAPKKQKKQMHPGVLIAFAGVLVVLSAVAAFLQWGGITEAEYNTYITYDDRFLDAEAAYLTEEGYVNSEDIPALLDEVEKLAQQGVADGAIEQYDRSDGTVFIEFSGGIPYLFIPYEKEMLSGGGGGRIITLEPNENDISVNLSYLTAKIDAIGNDIEYTGTLYPYSNAEKITREFPERYTYNYSLELPDAAGNLLANANEGDSLRNEYVTVEEMKTLGDYKIIIWEGHGGYSESIHSALITGESFVGFKAFSKYSREMAKDRVVLTSFPTISTENHDTHIPYSPVRYYAVTDKFFDKYIGKMDGSLLFLGACSSLKDDVLAQTFLDKGAAAVLGYTEDTSMPYEMISRTLFFDNLLKKDASGYATLGEAYQATINRVGKDYLSGKSMLDIRTSSEAVLQCTLEDLDLTTYDGTDEPTEETEPTVPKGGNGTAEYPYEIITSDQLMRVYDDLGACYRLEADIDVSSVDNWAPIGTEEAPFTGSFDGNGHVITNININTYYTDENMETVSVNTGFFGYTNGATVVDLGIRNATYDVATGDFGSEHFSNAGGIVGTAENTVVERCYFKGEIDNVTGENVFSRASGLVAIGIDSTVSDCYTDAVIHARATNMNTMAAGMVAWMDGTRIDRCYVAGSVTGKNDNSYSYVGGFNASANSDGGADVGGGTVSDSVVLLESLSSNFLAKYKDNVGNFSESYNNLVLDPDETEAYQPSTYEALGWDFDTVWIMNNYLPTLRVFEE